MNPAVVALKPSLIRQLHGLRKPDDFDLGLGQSPEKPDMAPFEKATRWIAENGCTYTPNAGSVDLRRAIVAHRGAPNRNDIEDVIVTHGSQEAIYLCVKALLDPEVDEVLIPGPAYGSYVKLCALEGVGCTVVDMKPEQNFEPRADVILAALTPQTRMIIVASPSNPTGRVWSHKQAMALVKGLKAHPGPPIWLVVDEVYRNLTYVEDCADFSHLYRHTLLVGGLSKSHALTGLRIGWLIGPAEALAYAGKVHQQVTTVTSTYSQQVALATLRDAASFTRNHGVWRGRQQSMHQALTQSTLDFVPLEGAFYAWVNLGDAFGGDSMLAAKSILEKERVITIPGMAFGPGGDGWLRLSYAGDQSRIQEGVQRIARCL